MEEKHPRPWDGMKIEQPGKYGGVVNNLLFQLCNLKEKDAALRLLHTKRREHLTSAGVQAPGPEKPGSDTGGSSYALDQPQIALSLYWGHDPDRPSSLLE